MKHLFLKIIYAALISTLAIGSVSPMSTAQAAPLAERVIFSMEIVNPKARLFCKETVTYLVRVELAQSNGAPTPAPGSYGFSKGLAMVNVKVEASSVNKRVGDFVGTEKGFAIAKTGVAFQDDLAALTGAAKFKFRANKPGKTTLYFEGLVGKEYVSANLVVEVLPCDFKVKTVSTFRVGMTSVGIMDGEMKADEQGNFTGSATVNWVTSMLCGISSPIAPGTADLIGTINEDGQLAGEITFGPMTSVGGGSCGVGVTTENSFSLDPLPIKASSEGVSVYTQTQALNATNGSFTGTATIVLIPDEDEAVSFVPDNYEASWDDPLGLFGTLLALR